MRRDAVLAPADEADWVMVPDFDLRELGDTGKGEARNPAPFRRDWLNQTMGQSTGLWLTKLLSEYRAAELAEGALVFCTDIQPAELLEGQLCLFRVNGGLVVGRFSYRPAGEALRAGDRLGEVYVTAGQIGAEEGQYLVVARILANFIRRI